MEGTSGVHLIVVSQSVTINEVLEVLEKFQAITYEMNACPSVDKAWYINISGDSKLKKNTLADSLRAQVKPEWEHLHCCFFAL